MIGNVFFPWDVLNTNAYSSMPNTVPCCSYEYSTIRIAHGVKLLSSTYTCSTLLSSRLTSSSDLAVSIIP
uniref:Uncharacterized protein n=1 Tax=Staphylothermus marinus TaxID=2280 RepID=A0A7J3PKZ5_STAMA